MQAVDQMASENQALVADKQSERERRVFFEGETKKLQFKLNEMTQLYNKLSVSKMNETTTHVQNLQCQVNALSEAEWILVTFRTKVRLLT